MLHGDMGRTLSSLDTRLGDTPTNKIEVCAQICVRGEGKRYEYMYLGD